MAPSRQDRIAAVGPLVKNPRERAPPHVQASLMAHAHLPAPPYPAVTHFDGAGGGGGQRGGNNNNNSSSNNNTAGGTSPHALLDQMYSSLADTALGEKVLTNAMSMSRR